MLKAKENFRSELQAFVKGLKSYISSPDGQWTVKGFIDVFRSVYSISSDTKIISKVLEIHLLPKILLFAEQNGYEVVLAKHQNYYPDISFVKQDNSDIKFAVDLKTTYRNANKPFMCHGFTLGSHGKYFVDRSSTKNIQFPYSAYTGHFCLGIIYSRTLDSDNSQLAKYDVSELKSITSVIEDFHFFAVEKWKIASDKSGSGNTANIGSINNISDITNERGMFSKLGEEWFDDYWMNYNKIVTTDSDGNPKRIKSLEDFVKYRKGDTSLIVARRSTEE